MNTTFLLMAQYNGAAVIPLEAVCRDYFSHLTPAQFSRKADAGQINIPIWRAESGSQKAARGIHINDLSRWIDDRREAAEKERAAIYGRR